jgi:hypothetical protein
VTDTEDSRFAERLIATARHNPGASALLHKERGTWVVRSWRDALIEIDHLAAGLRSLGLAAGGRVAVEGEVTARLFLLSAAIRAAGGRILSIASGASRAERDDVATDRSLSLVIAQGRDALAIWSEVIGTNRQVPIVFDHATPDNKPPEAGIVTVAKLKTLGEPRRWAADLASVSRTKSLPVTWFEETTGWQGGLDVLLDHWISSGEPVAVPELLAAAARDRLELSPQNWIASRSRLEANERSIRDRLPDRKSLAGWLVEGALRAARAPWFSLTRHALRSRLGLGRLENIEIHAGYEPGGAPALFRQLGLGLTLVGQRTSADSATPTVQPYRRKTLAVAGAR